MRKIQKLKDKPSLFINNLREKFSNANSLFPKIGNFLDSQTYGKTQPKKIIFNKNEVEKQYYNTNEYNYFKYNLKQEKRERVSKDLFKIKLEKCLKEQKEDLAKLYEQKKILRLEQIKDHEKYYQQKQKMRSEQIEDLEKYYQDKQNLRLEYITELKKISGLKKWN